MKSARFQVAYEVLEKLLLLPKGARIEFVDASQWHRALTVQVISPDFDSIHSQNDGEVLECNPEYTTEPDGIVHWKNWGLLGEL